MSYYGLYIPVKTGNEQSDSPIVFKEKHEALKFLKQHKDARLREFSNIDDASKYAQTGYEPSVLPKFPDVKPPSTANVEKLTFRVPTKQELVEFKKLIESDDHKRIKSLIWDNPRYLVSSGDTPTTLKEGYRYNALHICAISKKARIAELILKTVSDPYFVELLSGKKIGKGSKELCAIMLDYYLNMPEKGRCETPLHLAVKIGAVDVVEVLTSYPECKMITNSDGMLPKDIICSRTSDASPELRKKIHNLLEERFYVPVFRSLDGVVPPTVGQPFSTNSPPILKTDPLSPEVKIQALAGPMNKEQAEKFCRRWKTPPRIGSKITSPIANTPLISPIKLQKTPSGNSIHIVGNSNVRLKRKALFGTPRSQSSPINLSRHIGQPHNGNSDRQNGNHSTENSTTPICIVEANNNNNHDESKNISRELVKTLLYVKNKELFSTYRDHADSPINSSISSLNFSITENNHFDTPGYKERNLKITDTEKGLEIIGRQLAKEQNIDWKEYWDFLGVLVDISSPAGLQKLENFFIQRTKEEESLKKKDALRSKEVATLDDICSAIEKLSLCKDTTHSSNNRYNNGRNGTNNSGSNSTQNADTNNSTSYNNAPQSTTPYTCVEKSLQVFAKRMTKTILHNIENIVSINDAFLSELKRLKSLICSFKEDSRFLKVNFKKVHSRFANLIVNYLESTQDINAEVKAKIQKNLLHIIVSPGERKEQLICVCKLILNFMESDVDQIVPENLKTEMMCTKVWLMESNCDCQWENGLIRKSSRRTRMDARIESHHSLSDTNGIISNKKINKNSIWRRRSNPPGNDFSSNNIHSIEDNETDESEDEQFWSDFCSESDDDDLQFFTPAESPSKLDFFDFETISHNIFIYGNEPTKRDLDVVNAIFHVDIKKDVYPNIYSWKSAVLRYSSDDMDCFLSPSAILETSSARVITSSPFTVIPIRKINESGKAVAKSLFSSLSQNENRENSAFENDTNSSDYIVSPLATVCHDNSGNSKNLSLMNISGMD